MKKGSLVSLGEVAEITQGVSYSGEGLGMPGPSLVGMGNIAYGGEIDFSKVRSYGGRVKEEHYLTPNDVAVVMTDLTQDGKLLGSPGVLPKNSDIKAVASHHLQIIRPGKLLNPGYLKYLLSGPEWASYVHGVSTGTTVRAVSCSDTRSFTFNLPEMSDQIEIAKVLQSLDDKIILNNRISRLLELEARTAFELLFNVNPQQSGTSLLSLLEINPKRVLKQGVYSTYLGMSNVPTSSAIVERWSKRIAGSGQRFVNGDVLVSRITPCLENGKMAFVDFLQPDEIGWGSTEFLVFKGKKGVSKVWVYCLARSNEFREFAIRNMNGTSGRQRCSVGAFEQYFISEPDSKEVLSFGQRFEPNFSLMGKLRDENLVLRSTREYLIPQFLSNRLKVRNQE
jgi:type I restriction enzyme S subunit